MLQTCEEEGSLAELITTISLCVNKEAICNLSFLRLSFVPETQRVTTMSNTLYLSTQHSTQSNISCVGTVTQCHTAQMGV